MGSWLILAIRVTGFVLSPVGTVAFFAGSGMRRIRRSVLVIGLLIWLSVTQPEFDGLIEARRNVSLVIGEAERFAEVWAAITNVLATDARLVGPAVFAARALCVRRPKRDIIPAVAEGIDIGAVRGGGLLHFRSGGRLVFRPEVLRRHVVAIGSTGSGKTTTTMHLAAGAAQLGWSVIYIDAKGDHSNAQAFYATCVDAGVAGNEIIGWPYAAWDAWRGDARDIANRVLASQDFTEPYYRETARLAVKLATSAPGTAPPRSSAELIQRLAEADMKKAWKGNALARQWLDLDPKTRQGTSMRFSGFFSSLDNQLDGDVGFEDCTAAYFALDAVSLKDDAEAVGRLLLEDLAHWAARRKPQDEPALVVIDEFSAITTSSGQVAGLIERLRGFNVSVVLASQSVHGLGDEAERILDACGTLLLHQSSDPEVLTNRAGTFSTAEPTVQINDGGPTGMGSLRVNDQFKVSPNKVRRLSVGQCIVIHHGDYLRAAIDPPVHSTTAAPDSWRATQSQLTVEHDDPGEVNARFDISELEL